MNTFARLRFFSVGLILMFCFCLDVEATIWTVDNNVNSPGQYESLQTAIDSVNNGDTLMITPSPSSYGDFTLNKQLTFFGAKPCDGLSTTVGVVGLGAGGSKSQFQGIRFYNSNNRGANFSGSGIDSLNFFRCYFVSNAGLFNPYLNLIKSWSFINCIFDSQYFVYQFSIGSNPSLTINTFTFFNNIFNVERAEQRSNITYNNSLFSHNIFLQPDSTLTTSLGGGNGCVFSNNIYYGFHPTAGLSNSVYNNNLTYQTPNDSIPGVNNIIAQDPIFTNYSGGGFNTNHDYTFQSNSPAIGSAANGSDLGITGGSFPFTPCDAPNIPVIDELTLYNGAIEVNSQLKFRMKARKAN